MLEISKNSNYIRMMVVFGRSFNYPYCYLVNASTGDTLVVKTKEKDYHPLWDALYSQYSILVFKDEFVYLENTSMGEHQCIDFSNCVSLKIDDTIDTLMGKLNQTM